ncbi:protein yippee [Salix suchowensis]|nr:protein yippee [Salix suchowensis]
MGRLFVVNLEGKFYSCKHCRTHLALYDDIVSKTFQCKHGKAYLFEKVANVFVGEKEERRMITGLHVVADIFCVGCGSIVGWKYETAHEKSQKYKEGKSVLERFKLSGPDGSHYWGILNTTTLVEVMQTMFDHLPCRFIFVHSPLLIFILFQLSKLRRTELLVWTAVNQLSIIDSKHGLLILINPISSSCVSSCR